VIQGLNGGQIRVDGVLWDRYEEVIPGGDQVLLGADAVLLIAAGKTRLTFLGWSNGGPREQVLVSNPARPDTLSASFSLEHRLLLAAVGAGVVTTNLGDNPEQGVYLPFGTPVRLAATPLPGFTFVGWRGDTVATGTVLDIVMRKGYDLEARFVEELTIPAGDAATDLLGVPRLSQAQRDYLDELGNRNGLYDVGDLLALHRRTGTP
jgi:uncharacterized repeat protein (TIGR02543 family)